MMNTHLLELPLSRTYFHGSKGVRAIEVSLYLNAFLIVSRVGRKTQVLLPDVEIISGQHLDAAADLRSRPQVWGQIQHLH